MKNSNRSPAGPVMMAAGVILMVLCALLASHFPWLCMVMGLSGLVLFFVGFRILGGPSYFLCPNCGTKIYKQNQWVQLRRKEEAFRCPRCQTILRSDGGIII